MRVGNAWRDLSEADRRSAARRSATKDPDGAGPLDAWERRLHAQGLGFVCGVDEAGRGPLAGPVVVSAVVLAPDCRIVGVADSKTLRPRARELLAEEIQRDAIVWSVIAMSPKEIDRLNILHATMEGMRRAVEALPLTPDYVLVDGNRLPSDCGGAPWEAVVKGDGQVSAIAAASILAKVERDRIMVELDARHPGYGFAAHKGYPTPFHQRALGELGPSPVHRQSFRLDYGFRREIT